MDDSYTFKNKLKQAERGRTLFRDLTDIEALEEGRDAFMLVLTDSDACIQLALKYLPVYIETYGYRTHVYSSLRSFDEHFHMAGGVLHACKTMEDIQSIATYIMMFGQRDHVAPELIFLTDKDDYGARVEGLLENQEFTLEEYVKHSLFSLKK